MFSAVDTPLRILKKQNVEQLANSQSQKVVKNHHDSVRVELYNSLPECLLFIVAISFFPS
jgi:hypothetical protein